MCCTTECPDCNKELEGKIKELEQQVKDAYAAGQAEAITAPNVVVSNSSVLLCSRTIEACADLLDKEADRQERVWKDFLKSGNKGPATSYDAIPRAYAEMIRKLAV